MTPNLVKYGLLSHTLGRKGLRAPLPMVSYNQPRTSTAGCHSGGGVGWFYTELLILTCQQVRSQ